MDAKKAAITIGLVATGIALIIVSVPEDVSIGLLPLGLALDYLGFMLILSALGYSIPGQKTLGAGGLVQK